MPDSAQPQQLLHLVIGGELTHLEHNTFKDLDDVEIVGVYPNYAIRPRRPGRAKAQSTVDNAQMRYFIVHLHLSRWDPGQDTKPAHRKTPIRDSLRSSLVQQCRRGAAAEYLRLV